MPKGLSNPFREKDVCKILLKNDLLYKDQVKEIFKKVYQLKEIMQISYRVVPKNRRKNAYGRLQREIGKVLRKFCEYKGIEVLNGTACADHYHIFNPFHQNMRYPPLSLKVKAQLATEQHIVKHYIPLFKPV